MTEERRLELKEQERHYEASRLNVVFAWTSILLAAAVLWMVVDDYVRSWKGTQRTFAATDADWVSTAPASPYAPRFLPG